MQFGLKKTAPLCLGFFAAFTLAWGQDLCPPTGLEASAGDGMVVLEWVEPSGEVVIGQGGEDFSSAVEIPSIPAVASGTTSGYAGNYGPFSDTGLYCPWEGYYDPTTSGAGPDVVYVITFAADTDVTFALCNSGYDTCIGLFTESGSQVLGNDDFCGGGLQSQVSCVVPAGTYYVVVDGWSTASGAYTLEVYENGMNSRFLDCGTFSHYAVFRDGAQIGTTPLTTFSDTGLTNYTQYCYTVSAVYSEGSSAESNEACATPEPIEVVSLPISADFESGLPDGWSSDVSGYEGGEWQFGQDASVGSSPTGDNYAYINDDGLGSGTPAFVSILGTPFFSIPEAGSVLLSFDYIYEPLGDYFGLAYRLSPSDDWTALSAIDASSSWTSAVFDLTATVTGLASVQLAFYYDDMGSWAWWVGVDNVTITTVEAASLGGTVTSALGGTPVEGATVKIVEESLGFTFTDTTDASGVYYIDALTGSYTVSVRRSGYQSASTTGVVLSGAVTLDFVLNLDLPGAAGLSAEDGGAADVILTWGEPGSASEYALAYHDGGFEEQLGCGGGCGLGVRFTPLGYPAELVGLEASFQGDANMTAAVISVYLDPSAGVAGPPSQPIGPYDGTAAWESDPMALPSDGGALATYFVEIPSVAIDQGDFYVIIWENGSGFAGMGTDANDPIYDRNWAYAGGWSPIGDFGFNINWAQTAYLVGAGGLAKEAESIPSGVALRTPTLRSGKSHIFPYALTSIHDKHHGGEDPRLLSLPEYVSFGTHEGTFSNPQEWNSDRPASDRDTSLVRFDIYRDGSFLTSVDASSLTHTDGGLTYDVEYCYQVETFWSIGGTEVEGRPSNVACATPRLAGDVNGDHAVTVEDIVMAIGFILEQASPTDYEFNAADVNNDMAVNILDVVRMVDIMLGRASGAGRIASGDADALGTVDVLTAKLTHEAGQQVELSITSDAGVAGVQFELVYDASLLKFGAPMASGSQSLVFGREKEVGRMTVVALSLGGSWTGDSPLTLTLPVEVVKETRQSATTVEVTEIVISGVGGRAIPATGKSSTLRIESVPGAYALHSNFPNPFNPATAIQFDLKQEGRTELAVYNLTGQKIRTLVDGYLSAGYHEVAWNGTDDHGRPVAAGVYLYAISSGSFRQTRKMVFLK